MKSLIASTSLGIAYLILVFLNFDQEIGMRVMSISFINIILFATLYELEKQMAYFTTALLVITSLIGSAGHICIPAVAIPAIIYLLSDYDSPLSIMISILKKKDISQPLIHITNGLINDYNLLQEGFKNCDNDGQREYLQAESEEIKERALSLLHILNEETNQNDIQALQNLIDRINRSV